MVRRSLCIGAQGEGPVLDSLTFWPNSRKSCAEAEIICASIEDQARRARYQVLHEDGTILRPGATCSFCWHGVCQCQEVR